MEGNSETTEFEAMNGGDGNYSYFKNSNYQRAAANSVKEQINKEIERNFDVKYLSSVSDQTIRIADLGCSTGPNTFIAMQNVVEAIKKKHHSQCPNSEPLNFQVFFNDRTSNDFNTLFNLMPLEREYFPVGVPGSFHSRLFPESSLHLVYTCHALHWLSKIPEQMLDKNSPACKGQIYYLNAPKEVCNSYASQFNKDIEIFLNARAKEIVQGGIMVIIMAGRPNGVDSHSSLSYFSITFDFIGKIFTEMAKEGLISEALVDSYNIPIYAASPEEMVNLVEENTCFGIEHIEFSQPETKDMKMDISVWMKHVRAGIGGMLMNKHFGNENTDQMLERLEKYLIHDNDLLTSASKDSGQLFIVLKRK